MHTLVINDNKLGYLDAIGLIGIRKGDILVLSSDITRIWYKEYHQTGEFPSVDKFIDTFIEIVGDEGTILIPMFNWDFCKGKTFDIKRTKGRVGALGNEVLKRTDFRRTKHPIYSFLVWGKYKDYLCDLDNIDSFGVDTPFDFLYKYHSKWVFIDINLDQGFTFVHHMEQIGKVPYRFNKSFVANYIDYDGNLTEREYSMFVRKLELNPIQDMKALELEYLESGIANNYIINDIRYMVVDTFKAYLPLLNDIINNNCKKIYKYDGQN